MIGVLGEVCIGRIDLSCEKYFDHDGMIAERAVCHTSKVRSFRRELRQSAERDDLLRARRPRRLLPVAEPAGNVQAGLGDQSLQFVLRCELDLRPGGEVRSEEHTSELPSLMRISYAVFCLTK